MEKRQKTIALAVIITTLVISIGVTVAYFVAPITKTNQTTTVTTGTLKLTLNDNTAVGFAGNIQFGEERVTTFSIENTGTLDAHASIYWKNLVNTFLEGSMVYTLTYGDSTKATSTYQTPITNQNIPRSVLASEQILIEDVLIPANKTYNFTLKIKLIDSPTIDQTADLNANFYTEFTIKEYRSDTIALESLYTGANPNNYICIDSDETPCPQDNLYRIISTNGNTIKVIKSTVDTTQTFDSDTYITFDIKDVN